MTTAQITNHVDVALDRLSEQFKGKPKIAAFLTALVSPLQDVENAFWQLFTERTIDAAIGNQLDVIGRVVTQPRNGLTDDPYRKRIRAKIASTRSDGLIEELLAIAALTVDDDAAVFELLLQQVASITLRVRTIVPTDDTADALIGFLSDAVSGGVRIILETLTDTEAESFTFASAGFLNGTVAISSNTLVLSSAAPADWPSVGSLDIDVALAVAETVTYTQISSDRLTITCSTTTAEHVDGACVQLSGGPGKGFDDFDSPGAGGKFIDARGN